MSTVTSSKQRKLKIANLLADIQSGQASKTTTALDALQVVGDESVIEPLILEMGKGNATGEILEFLSSLKNTPAKAKIMECVLNPTLKAQQQLVLSSVWNSPLDYSEYLSTFVKLAVSEDFMTTLECLTIIENLEGPFEEQSVLESQLFLKEYLDGEYPKTKEKNQLISEIAILIKDIDRNLQD